MRTERLAVNADRLSDPESQQALDRAASILRAGGTVALPTETVYGLGANALDAKAVAAIFEAKQRPGWDPLIVHVSDQAMLAAVTLEIPDAGQRLMQAYWPGPLTLLLPRSPAVPDAVTAGRRLVGVRMPAHPVALEVIRRAGVPIAAPSANRFGHTSPTTAEHVLADLDGRIDAVVDGGPTLLGLESTVADVTVSPIMIYRPGAVTVEQIMVVAGPAMLLQSEQLSEDRIQREALPSPGVGLRHYAPRARLILLEKDVSAENWAHELKVAAAGFSTEKVGIMLPEGLSGNEDLTPSGKIFRWGSWSNSEELAHRLFAGLRYLDDLGCTVILCPVPSEQGIGVAIRDRLRKAAWPT
jgi:L-threonylcarbamoyladenylate synthase